jgi:predicted nucleic acid-binding protein
LGLQKNPSRPFLKVIIDTGVWSAFFRREHGPQHLVAEVERLVRADVIQMLGPIRQELLSGAWPEDRFERLKEYLRFFPNLPLEEQDDELAAEYYNSCRSRGIQGSATDLIICAVSARYEMRIFSIDRDFENYCGVLPIRLHRLGKRP